MKKKTQSNREHHWKRSADSHIIDLVGSCDQSCDYCRITEEGIGY